ncbi:MAG: diacylglycerol/lipid kinase family protein [Flavobacteriales bacterium]
MDEQKIAFIVNKGSGNVWKRASKIRLIEYLEEFTSYTVFQPGSAEESAQIVQRLVQEQYAAVFACGGDGTLNAISKQLLYSNTALGIVPMGSGNGFARHWKIPLRWNMAIAVAENHREVLIDTGRLGDRHFLNVAGVGYSAHVAKAFKQAHGRGVWGYVRTILLNLKLDKRQVDIKGPGSRWQGLAWTVEFANGSQWGGNVKVAPAARMDDAKLEVAAFRKIPGILLPWLGLRVVLNKAAGYSRRIYRTSLPQCDMNFEGIWEVHTDGDYAGKISGQLHVEVVPAALRVWVPPATGKNALNG